MSSTIAMTFHATNTSRAIRRHAQLEVWSFELTEACMFIMEELKDDDRVERIHSDSAGSKERKILQQLFILRWTFGYRYISRKRSFIFQTTRHHEWKRTPTRQNEFELDFTAISQHTELG
jgi:hypothetical protein